MAEKLSDQELARRAKLDKYKELGIDPFGQAFDQKNHSQEVKDIANKQISAFKEANKDLDEETLKNNLHEYLENKTTFIAFIIFNMI
jgi:lysyl-tRNA synthetase class II